MQVDGLTMFGCRVIGVYVQGCRFCLPRDMCTHQALGVHYYKPADRAMCLGPASDKSLRASEV